MLEQGGTPLRGFASTSTPRQWAAAAVVVLTAAACIAVPAWQLIVPGPFDWHLQQPQTWQGGLEALALIALLGFSMKANTRWQIVLLGFVPLALYARRHAIDVPLLINIFYLEILIGLGMLMRRLSGQPSARSFLDYLHALVSGIAIWSLFAWTLSAVDFGSIKALRWMTAILLVPAVLAGHRPLLVHLWTRIREQTPSDRAWCGALTAWLTVLYARTKTATGHDSLWYGLKAEYVLAPASTVYESLALVSPVHYYPKIYEMLLLPVSAAGDTSIIAGMSVLLLVPLLMAAHVLMRETQLPRHARLPVLALITTLPALANIAGETKPDVFAVLFALVAAIMAIRLVHTRSLADGAWLLSCVILACCAKLTAIPYLGLLLVFTAIMLRTGTRQTPLQTENQSVAPAVMTLIVVVCVAMFVLARTFILAGLPTIGPDPLFKIWHALGFELRPPAGTLPWTHPQDWTDVPALLIDWAFRPHKLPHVVITWVGNVWIWLLLAIPFAAVMLGAKEREKLPARVAFPFVVLIGTGVVLAIGVKYLVRGSDGNYFLYSLIPAILITSAVAFRRIEREPLLRASALACVSAIALFQASYSFVSGAWSPGTRSFDADLSRPWKQARAIDFSILSHAGMSEISRYLKDRSGVPRVVGIVEQDYLYRLPARYEDLRVISYSRPEYTSSAAGLIKYISQYDIHFLVLPHQDLEMDSSLRAAIKQAAVLLEELEGTRVIRDQRYTMLDLSAVSRDVWDRTTEKRDRQDRNGILNAHIAMPQDSCMASQE